MLTRFRDINDEDRKLIRAKGKKCEAEGCTKEIEVKEIIEEPKAGSATWNRASYFCREHAEKHEASGN
jgi:hypothetical protein